MARRRRTWIQEERRRTLGDWVAFCVGCGFTVRFFTELESEVSTVCPHCRGELRRRCPSCDSLIASAFAVECEECEAPLRAQELFGGPIRKPGR